MEYLNQSKVCRKFLNQYNEKLIPKLLPKLVKIAIFNLYKTFHKCLFSMQELDQYIKLFNDKKGKFELEPNNDNAPPCSPNPDYLTPKLNRIQKLHMNYQSPEGLANSENEKEADILYGYRRFFLDDEIYINKKNNFYDENYFIPRTRSYRNIQLYQNRLKNPRFTTQEKKIYPDWWWNLKDDIDQDDYSDDNSKLDHHSGNPYLSPKNKEKVLKKEEKYLQRPNSYDSIKPVVTRNYEDSNIHPNSNPINYNSYKDNGYYEDPNIFPNGIKISYDNYNYKGGNQNPITNNSPSKEENSEHHNNMAATDGFNKYFPKIMNDNKESKINNYNIRYYSSNINDAQNYVTSPNFKGPLNNLALSDGFIRDRIQFIGNPGKRDGQPNCNIDYPYYSKDKNQNQLSSNQSLEIDKRFPDQQISINCNLCGTTEPKILNIKHQKESFVLSYDKDFKISESKVKRNGKIKNGLRFLLDGNQIKEYSKTKLRKKKLIKTNNDK